MGTATIASEEVGARVPPRDNLVRAVQAEFVEYRDDSDDDNTIGLLRGHFARFNEWTTIRSAWEGEFLERISPGAFKKTIRENRDRIKVLYDHGLDPSIGNKPLGPIRSLTEDDEGAYYEVPLFDTSYNRDLLPGLRAGVYGASFRFRIVREDYNDKPRRSDSNPDGMPERTIKELQLMEFGPVTFPAYAGATAGVRSCTDDFLARTLAQNPDGFRRLLEANKILLDPEGVSAPTEDRAEPEAHPESVRRDNEPFDHFAAWQRQRRLEALTGR